MLMSQRLICVCMYMYFYLRERVDRNEDQSQNRGNRFISSGTIRIYIHIPSHQLYTRHVQGASLSRELLHREAKPAIFAVQTLCVYRASTAR